MRVFFSVLLLLFCNTAFSQTYMQTIKGTVTDKDSREPLPGANVIVLDMQPVKGVISDPDGNFRIDGIPAGRHTLKVSLIGYKEAHIQEILVSSGKETVVNIELIQSVTELNEVRVIASRQDKDKSLNSMATVSARKLNMQDASRYAGGFYDPARMVSSFAGVATVEGDGVNDIIIRGNSPRGLLWRLEGIEIPNPNHFTDGQGGTGGAISIISSNVLSTSDFFSGAFPSEYGNAYSGVMDLNLRKGNSDKQEYAFQLGVAGTEFSMEGPFAKSSKSSYLINYRYSTLGYLSQLGLIDLGNNNMPPVFQDYTVNINIPTKNAGAFSVFSIGGYSTTGTNPVKDSLKWISGEGRYFETEKHWMGVAGLKHAILLRNKKTNLKSSIAFTFQKDKWNEGILDKTYERFNEYLDNFSYPTLRFNLNISHKQSARNTISGGITASRLFFDMLMKEYNYSLSRYDVLVNQKGNGNILQSYLQWKHRFSDDLEVNTGAHCYYSGINGHTSIEPRIGLRMNMNPKSSLNIGAGLHSRGEAVSAYLSLIPQPSGSAKAINKNIDFIKAAHFVLGYDYSFMANWRLKIEAYYQHLYNIPVEKDPDGKLSAINFSYGVPDIALVNNGKGVNYGLEFTLEKFYTNDYYMLGTVSLSDSRFLANNGKWYNTVFNCGYVTNFLAGKDFKTGRSKQNIFGMNIKGLVRGGYRISPIDKQQTAAEQEIIYDDTHIFSEQLPAFSRIDLGIYLRVNKARYSYIVSADIQNVINRQNTMGYEYENGKIQPVIGMGLIPVLNFRIEF